MFRRFLKFLLPSFLHKVLKKIYYKINPPKPISADKQLLQSNEEIFKALNMDISKVKTILENNQLAYSDGSLSWHYHLFAGLNQLFEQKNIAVKNILEIGTHNGSFTQFLSNTYPNAQVYSIDLPQDNSIFNSTYGRDDRSIRDEFLKLRNTNLSSPNITFIEMNSSNLLEKFSDIKFDAIWVDGDHLNPQVTMDIMNSLHLLHQHGVLCVDDVIKNECFADTRYASKKYVSSESYQTLKNLEDNNILSSRFVMKRTFANQKTPKFVSVSTKK